MLSEISYSQKDKYHLFPIMYGISKTLNLPMKLFEASSIHCKHERHKQVRYKEQWK